MRVDINKIDERIRKLQEVRRIAADAELMALLSEFAGVEEDRAPQAAAAMAAASSPASDGAAARVAAAPDDTGELVKEMVGGAEPKAAGGSLWGVRRG